MKRPDIAAKTPPKGMIVCDSSGLLPLMAALPFAALTKESYQKTPLPTVFDGLVFLAKHGYEVVIPEMIAYEMANAMRDGESHQNLYFPQRVPTTLDKALAHRSFFRDIVRLQHDGVPIRIQPPLPDDTSPEATYLNAVYRIHVLPISAYEKRGNLLDLHHPQRRNHAGDKQIQTYIDSLPVGETPIYILSNDAKLQHSFPNRTDVNGLGANAFYEALKREGFLNCIGINPDAFDFVRHTQEYYTQYDLEMTKYKSSDVDTKCGYSLGVQTEPFAAGMKQLAQDINVQTSAAGAASEMPALTVEGGGEASKPMIPSQLDKWAKWKK